MKLKKLLCLVLSVMLIMGAVSGLTFAAEETEAEVYGSDSIGILNALGIAEIPAEELGDTINRADFLKLMGILAGYGEIKTTEQVFSDMSLEDEREPYLKALYNVGIIAPDGSGKIYPNAEIGLSEAAAIAVKVTGYSLMAESRGGYPSGYFSVAKKNKILDGLPSSQYTVVTKGMAARLALNTLKSDLMVQTGFGNETNFEEKKGTTLLSSVWKTYYIKDVVSGVDISRVMGENDVEAFFLEIGELELEARKIKNVYSYLGYSVDAYYTVDKGDIPRAIWLEKTDKNTETVIEIDDITEVSATKVKVYNEEKKSYKTYNFSRSIPVIYNGVATKQAFSPALIEAVSGKMILVDNSGDKTADVLFLNVYETVVVGQVDTSNNVVYDKYNSKNKIKLDVEADDPYTVIYDESGKEVRLSKIKADDVLAVFASAPDAYQGYKNVYIIDKTVTGTVERTKDNGKKVIVDGIEYEVTEKCRTKFSSILKPGQSVILKLDYDGKAAWADKAAETEYKYGYLAAADTGRGLGGDLKFKIYTVDNGFVIYDSASSILIDGKKYTSDDPAVITVLNKAAAAMHNTEANTVDASCTASMVRYKLNASGNVNAIDTILNASTGVAATREDGITSGDDSMFGVKLDKSVDRARTSYRIIGPRNSYSTTSIMFFYPDPLDTTDNDVNDEDNYTVATATSLIENEKLYSGYAFYTDPKMYTSEFIAVQASIASSSTYVESSKFSIFDEVYEVLDEKTGDTITAVSLFTANGKAEIPVKDEKLNCIVAVDDAKAGLKKNGMSVATDLRKGDVVIYSTDIRGYLSGMTLYFRVDGMANGVSPSTSWWSSRRQRFGFVYDKTDNGMLVYFVDTADKLNDKTVLSSVTANDCELVSNYNAGTTYYSYEEGRPGEMEIKGSSFDALKSYKDTEKDCSRIYMQQNYARPMAIYSF